MQTDSRRSFVRKSIATTVSFSFAGLIRAHGEEGGETTSTTAWETTHTTTSVPWETTYNTTISYTTVDPFETTADQTTTISTTTSAFTGVIGVPAGYNESNIVQGGGGFVSAKAQITCDPSSGSGNSVTIKVRSEIWETENYTGTVKDSEWTVITGRIDENGRFKSSASDSANNLHGAVLKSSLWIAFITVKSVIQDSDSITLVVEFTLEYGNSQNISTPIPITLSVKAN